MDTKKPENVLQKDASMEELWRQFLQLLAFAGRHRKQLLLWPLVFGVLGLLAGVILSTNEKRAEYIIAAEEESSAGWEGLLAQFGLDVGGSNPAGVFQGESLVRLFQTRTLVERSLLQEVVLAGDTVILADALFAGTKMARKPIFKEVKFSADRRMHNSLTDSALYLLYKHVRKDLLRVSKPDKKQTFINVTSTHVNGELAVVLGGAIIETVTDYYIETLTKKARKNLDVLRLEADSVQRILDENLMMSAELSDLNVNPLKQTVRVSQNRSMIDLQISVALYGELAKNLKLAEIGLRKQTPLIQIIEKPAFPLERVGLRFWEYIFAGMAAGLGFGMYLIYLKVRAPRAD
ncbi:MAG: hypothetical protein ACK417_10670 [Bacteroidia bacterium]